LKTLTLDSFAKLNLYLSVHSKRRDGFHSINTIFERISLCDRIILKDRSDARIVCSCSGQPLPVDSRNLAVRAAQILSQRYAPDKGAAIRLIKRVPQGAGMGGGSSNAASVLLGLNRLWKLGLSLEQLSSVAARIGSDVPFFVHTCRFALARGRGELIKPVTGLRKRLLWHVIVVPGLHVSTPLIYKQWDKLRANKNIDISRLTRPSSGAKLMILALQKKGRRELAKALFNSLETAALHTYPGLAEVPRAFAGLGISDILMSGSGSAFFGIVSSRKEAGRISRQLKKHHASWHVFVARTV